jgi:hypothetical protein
MNASRLHPFIWGDELIGKEALVTILSERSWLEDQCTRGPN